MLPGDAAVAGEGAGAAGGPRRRPQRSGGPRPRRVGVPEELRPRAGLAKKVEKNCFGSGMMGT